MLVRILGFLFKPSLGVSIAGKLESRWTFGCNWELLVDDALHRVSMNYCAVDCDIGYRDGRNYLCTNALTAARFRGEKYINSEKCAIESLDSGRLLLLSSNLSPQDYL